MDLAFVILHYIVVEETISCAESIIQKVGSPNYCIIIVDNASPNDSYQLLREKYAEDARFHLIKNEGNFGFARGNNVGFQYAKNQLNAKYIVLQNNDTELVQQGFFEQINRLYLKERYAVLGPLILSRDGKCTTNPASLRLKTELEISELLKACNRELLLNKAGISSKQYKRLLKILRFVRKPFNHREKPEIVTDCYFKVQHTNVKLNGSCLVFSPDYIRVFDGLDNRTFMYFEEEILLLHVMNNGLTTLYSPELVIYHKEDGATDVEYFTCKRKRRFILENLLNSIKVYQEVKKEYLETKTEQVL